MIKKYLLIVIFLLSLCTLKAEISTETWTRFSRSWLYQYDPNNYDMEIHPYEVSLLDELLMPPRHSNVFWDFNVDGIVNWQDFVILSKIDMEQMILDMQVLKKYPLLEEDIEDLVFKIYDKEQELGIPEFQLAKNLLWQADYHVRIYSYTPHEECYFMLYWSDEFNFGRINMHAWKELLYFRYTYEYLFMPFYEDS